MSYLFAEPVDTVEVVDLVEAAGGSLVSTPDILGDDGGAALSEHIQHVNGNTAVLVVDNVLEDGGQGVANIVGQELGEGADNALASGSVSVGSDHGVARVIGDHVVETRKVLLVDELDESAIELEDDLKGLLLVTGGGWAVLLDGTLLNRSLQELKIGLSQHNHVFRVTSVLDDSGDLLLFLLGTLSGSLVMATVAATGLARAALRGAAGALRLASGLQEGHGNGDTAIRARNLAGAAAGAGARVAADNGAWWHGDWRGRADGGAALRAGTRTPVVAGWGRAARTWLRHWWLRQIAAAGTAGTATRTRDNSARPATSLDLGIT